MEDFSPLIAVRVENLDVTNFGVLVVEVEDQGEISTGKVDETPQGI